MSLEVNKNPCTTCPYRKDVPSGVWSEEEYEKLRGYDDPQTNLGLFLCHQSAAAKVNMACKGWVMVQQHSIAVRLACTTGQLDYRTCFDPTTVELYESGNAAADAGEKHIDRPRRRALEVISKLKKTGRFKVNNMTIEDAAVSLFEHLKHSIGEKLRSTGRGKGIDHDERTIVVEYKGDEEDPRPAIPDEWLGFAVQAKRFIRGG